MNYLLDTCVFAEFKKREPDKGVLEWLDGQIEQSLYISVVTIGEIQKGISALPESKRRKDLEKWLRRLIFRYDSRILILGKEEMISWGELNGGFSKKGISFPFLDSLIAATVLTNDMTLVTRNESDFKNTGVRILNIWK